MNTKLFLVFAVFIAMQATAQTPDCTPTLPYQVYTSSGLKMRAGPGTNYDVVVTVPSKKQILVCEELSTPATYEGNAGHWRKVKYKKYIGYMFDGFLQPVATADTPKDFELNQLEKINAFLAQHPEKRDSVMAFLNQVSGEKSYEQLMAQNQTTTETNAKTDAPAEKIPEEKLQPALDFKFITEAYNYCGDISELDPGKVWYAIYKKQDTYLMKRVDLLIVRSKYSLGSGLEFDLKADKEINAQFLFSVGKRIDTNWHVTVPGEFLQLNPTKLFPGQAIELFGTEPSASLYNTTVFATGNVTNVGKCPEMSNYKINVTGEMHDKLIVQDLTPDFEDLGECGIPKIFWFGDLNNDKYPEIIFVSESKEGVSFTFFASDLHNKNKLYRKATQWFNHNCN